MSDRDRPAFLCLASRFEGGAFLEAAARLGVETMLLTVDSQRDAAWPREAIGDFFTMADGLPAHEVRKLVYKIARHARIDRVIAIAEPDLALAAMLREDLRLPGMGQTTAGILGDTLATRARAQQGGIRVPQSVRIVYYDELRRWMDTVPAPWVLRPRQSPRTLAQELPLRTVGSAKEVWRALEEAGDLQNEYLLEQAIPGETFHVESLMWEKKTAFQAVHSFNDRDGIVTMQLMHPEGKEGRELRATDRHLVSGLGMVGGAVLSEYVRSSTDGEIYLIKSSARVSGAVATQMVHDATGVNLWEEWARIELAMLRGQGYAVPQMRQGVAGALMCRTRQQMPDLGAYTGEEIASRFSGVYESGVIVRAETPGQLGKLLESLRERFRGDFAV